MPTSGDEAARYGAPLHKSQNVGPSRPLTLFMIRADDEVLYRYLVFCLEEVRDCVQVENGRGEEFPAPRYGKDGALPARGDGVVLL